MPERCGEDQAPSSRGSAQQLDQVLGIVESDILADRLQMATGATARGGAVADAGDHAGELETSVIQAIRPGLVAFDQADPGTMAATRFSAVNKGWVEITRPWHLLTTNSGAGDPRPSTPEKGAAIAEIAIDRIANFLAELAKSPVDEAFPY